MRVLYLCVGMNDLGGTSSHLLNIAQNIGSTSIQAELFIGTKIPDRLRSHFRESPIPVRIEAAYKRWGYIPFLWRLIQELRQRKIDVIHSFQLQSDILAVVAGLLSGVSVRISSFEGRLLYGSTRFRKNMLSLLDRLIRPFITCNIFISRHLLEMYGDIHHIPRAKRKLIYLGLPPSWFQNTAQVRKDAARLRIGFVGRIDAEKGYELFIEAVRILVERGVNADFVMIGHGQLYSDAVRRVQQAHLEVRMEMRGWRDDMKKELSQLDMVVLPSHEEGLSFVALEALSQRRVVIATRVGGLPEIIQNEKTGLLVTPENPKALADAIAHLIAEWSRWSFLGDAGHDTVRQTFDIQQEIKNFFALYQTELHRQGIPL